MDQGPILPTLNSRKISVFGTEICYLGNNNGKKTELFTGPKISKTVCFKPIYFPYRRTKLISFREFEKISVSTPVLLPLQKNKFFGFKNKNFSGI